MGNTSAHGPLKLGMVGGGRDAFIGAVHRLAAQLDASFVLTAGALSSSPEKALASARELGLAPERSYGSWKEMAAAEAKRPAGERIDAVTIVTPNATHFEIARGFLEAGIPVILDKPMVTSVREARELAAAVEKTGTLLAVTYNYTGYPMVKHAAHLVRSGELGTIRKVIVEYHQGWLATKLEDSGQKQAAWRNDPAQAGAGGSVGDIGTHAENLLSTVTGLKIEALCAELNSLVPGRTLDDDATILMRLSGGARAVITVCQVAIGEQNNLTLRVHGDKGSLWWRQEEPNHLKVATIDGTMRILSRGEALSPGAAGATRLPPGHPEGFIEGFANVYRGVAAEIRRRRVGSTDLEARSVARAEIPTVHDGLRGVAFIEHVVRSAKAGGAWVKWEG